MSDLGSHWNNLAFWALKLKAPLSIEASGPAAHPEIAPASMQATYQFPELGEMPAGLVSNLTADQLSDLISYLESLTSTTTMK